MNLISYPFIPQIIPLEWIILHTTFLIFIINYFMQTPSNEWATNNTSINKINWN